MKFTQALLLPLALILVMTAGARHASAQAEHVQWNIASVPCSAGGGYPCTLIPDGSATATATDCFIPGAGCTSITLAGSGTFTVPASGGSSSGVTGGGTWKVTAADGTITSGTFAVTELIEWQKSEPLDVPACAATDCSTIDLIGNIRNAWGGVAVLRVAYSDGTTGVVTLACSGLPDPAAIAEGITATKIVKMDNIAIPGINVPPLPPNFATSKLPLPVLFWNAGVFAYFVEFHVR